MTEWLLYELYVHDKNEALVEFSNDVNMLTLSTCNSFGRKDDRYVVEADLVSTAVL